MEISIKTSLTDADKRVYMWKFIHTLLTVLAFVITYSASGNYELAMFIAIAGVVGLASLIAIAGAGTVTSSSALSLAGAAMFASGITIAVAGAFTGAVAVSFADAVAGATMDNKKYRVSGSSNLISAVIQLLLTWYLLYLAQFLHIPVSVSWH